MMTHLVRIFHAWFSRNHITSSSDTLHCPDRPLNGDSELRKGNVACSQCIQVAGLRVGFFMVGRICVVYKVVCIYMGKYVWLVLRKVWYLAYGNGWFGVELSVIIQTHRQPELTD